MKIRLASALLTACILSAATISPATPAWAKDKPLKKAPTTEVKAPASQPALSKNPAVLKSASDDVTVMSEDRSGRPALKSPSDQLAGEEINWDVLAAGGGMMSSGSFILEGTLGQAVAGETAGPEAAVNAGFWQDFGPGDFLCGDVAKNNRIDITDAVFIIQYIFAAGPAPVPIEAGDVDCNSRIAISDAVYIIHYIFASGPAPCAACM